MPTWYVLPSITLGDTAEPEEVWNMFWQASSYLNGSICHKTGGGNIGFGLKNDVIKNISPHKIRFNPLCGHSHGAHAWGGPLSYWALRKRVMDLNTLPVLWANYFDTTHGKEFPGGDESVYTVHGGEFFIQESSYTSNHGVKTDIDVFPGSGATGDLDVDDYEFYDATWDTYRDTCTLVAFFPQVVKGAHETSISSIHPMFFVQAVDGTKLSGFRYDLHVTHRPSDNGTRFSTDIQFISFVRWTPTWSAPA